MNVKIVNKYATLLAALDVDFIKSIEGEFTPEDITNQFQSFFYNKMIIDITAIKDYQDITKIQELSINMDMSKVIFLLDDSEIVNSPRYLSQLVSMGIYNFTRNVDAIRFLIDNPNTYKDVAQYHQLNMMVEEPVQKDNKKNKKDTLKDNKKNNESQITEAYTKMPTRVIGIKNVTEHAGSTTLTYLMKKSLSKVYNVATAEIDNHDFVYFNDHELRHIDHMQLQDYINANYEKEVILLDLNDRSDTSMCTEVLYLVEPGLTRLNKLINQDHQAFERLKGEKIILNRSVLTEKDVEDFEHESRSEIFFNMPNVDDKVGESPALIELLLKLGFVKLDSNFKNSDGKMFNVFK